MDGQLAAVYGLTMGSIGVAASVAYPAVEELWWRMAGLAERFGQAKAERAGRTLDEIFVEVKADRLKRLYALGPLAGGLAAYLLFRSVWLAIGGAVLGLVLPDLWVRQVRAMRHARFHAQLVDALFIISSSLKAGLSLIQAMEVVESEMGPPISQEFGLMVKAHRLGRTFEESLRSLNERMQSEEVNLITTALLVGRETGGDVTEIIGRLIATIREKKKLTEKTKTLTLQGRLQAYIMSALPVGFVLVIRTFNSHYFDPMLGMGLGRSLIVLAVLLWLGGMVILLKLCKVEI